MDIILDDIETTNNPVNIEDWEYPDSFDPDQVRGPAIYFLKHGTYCKEPQKSFEYDKYWDEQEQLCLHGLTSQGVYITGRHYFFLNFTPMMIVDGSKLRGQSSERLAFPLFMEYDYYWFRAKEEAKLRGQHMACVKTRRAGVSYKEAADAVYNYNFIRQSKSYLFAARDSYLSEDGIMNKVWDNINHLNEHTDWYKNRQVKSSFYHAKASYVDSDRIEKGYKSEIMAVVCDDPDKVRGKSGVKITFEEGGSFRNVLKAWSIAEPQVKQGAIMKGSMTILGTGGEEGEDILGLETIFYNPKLYNCLEFINIWDNQSLGSKSCGFFIPCYAVNQGYIHPNGKYDRLKSKAYFQQQRENKKESPEALDRYIAELPFTPREAFMRIHHSVFQIEKIKEQELVAIANQGLVRAGILYKEGTNVLFRPVTDREHEPLLDYPIMKGTIAKSSVLEYQTPYKDSTGEIPNDMYFMTLDPYILDGEHESLSIGAVRVWKQPKGVMLDKNKMILCSTYDARPYLQSEFYDTVFLMAKRWNAKINFELQGGGQKIRDEARQRKLESYLAYTPLILNNKEVKSYKNRSYGITMNTNLKRQYIRAFADWLKEVIGETEEGEEITNLNMIYDLGLLRELQKFDMDGNFDRVDCAIYMPLVLAELENTEIQHTVEDGGFFTRDLFK